MAAIIQNTLPESGTVTHIEALKQIRKHGVENPFLFYCECGKRDSYDVKDILNFLNI